MGSACPEPNASFCECAATVAADQAGAVLDDALRKGLTTVERMKAFLSAPEQKGRRGLPLLRDLVRGRDLNDEKVRSVMETRMLAILRRIEHLRFVPDHPLVTPEGMYIADFYLPDPDIDIECHSRRWHGPQASLGDMRRDRNIRSLGTEILYFDWEDVVGRPIETEVEIRKAISRRLSQRWGTGH
ncbi:MAG: hypothetical protein ACLGHL_00345 [Actinomycetota bacterium]